MYHCLVLSSRNSLLFQVDSVVILSYHPMIKSSCLHLRGRCYCISCSYHQEKFPTFKWTPASTPLPWANSLSACFRGLQYLVWAFCQLQFTQCGVLFCGKELPTGSKPPALKSGARRGGKSWSGLLQMEMVEEDYSDLRMHVLINLRWEWRCWRQIGAETMWTTWWSGNQD